DRYATVAQAKRKKPDMSATEMSRLKKEADFMSNVSFVATTDNKALLKVELTDQQKQMLQAAQAPATAPAAAAAPGSSMPPDVARRYGLTPRGGRPPAVRAPVPAAQASKAKAN